MTDLTELRKLAEAATPGPWQIAPDGFRVFNCQQPINMICFTAHNSRTRTAQASKTTAFITAANPQTVLALLDRIAKLEAALRPFARLAPKVEQFIEGTVTFGGSPIFSTKDFRLADFRRAAEAMRDT